MSITLIQSLADDIHAVQTDRAVKAGLAQAATELPFLHAKRDEIIASGSYDKQDGMIAYRVGIIGNSQMTYNVLVCGEWAKVTIWKLSDGAAMDILVDDRGQSYLIDTDGGFELEACDAYIAANKIMALRAKGLQQ